MTIRGGVEMSRGKGNRLTTAEKAVLSERALVMSIKGQSTTQIAQDLQVAWNTANSLVKHALKKRDIDEDAEREKSLAHHREIIRWCWEQLETDELGKNAQNRPAYINRIQVSQSEIDRLNNVTPPSRQEVNVSYRDYTTGEQLDALFDLDRSLDAAWQSYQAAHSEESLDTKPPHG